MRDRPEKYQHAQEWNAIETDKRLLARYERLVAGHSIEEYQQILDAFYEMAEDLNSERQEASRLMRLGGGKLIDDDSGESLGESGFVIMVVQGWNGVCSNIRECFHV